MPIRKVPLVANEIYHVYNRGVEHRPIFLSKRDYERALESLIFYQFQDLPLSFSHVIRLPIREKEEILSKLPTKSHRLVNILCFSLMPNHFHLLLKQLVDNGISRCVGNFMNSYTRYFNVRHERDGHLFQGQFKAVRIETEEQLIHVSRYIHLNPFSSYILKTIKDLETYPWTSFPEYIGETSRKICNTEMILSHFSSKNKYREFVFDQAEYQRRLEDVKHLLLE